MENSSFQEILDALLTIKKHSKKAKASSCNELYTGNNGLVPYVESLKQEKVDSSVIKLPKSFQTEDAITRYYGTISSPKQNIHNFKA